ncbi:MAG: tryptophan synthase subunit alpha [Bacillaceae bacterium G1]|nr:tryptophan synthase subunit alpha [Bacillota bacterium]OJF18113.1 MAG: tryptophan synthase subunit alpha [Bacillaceae bacterium G1]
MTGANRIDAVFSQTRSRPAFIPYITCGYPSLEASRRLLHLLDANGAEVIELGVPYSDPLADGPVIQHAAQRALANGTRLKDVLSLAARGRSEGLKAGLILFSYINPLLQYGLPRLFQSLQEAGFDGLIVPDLPVEESGPVRQLADAHGIHLIPLVAPNSLPRLDGIVQAARGMIYCISSLGVTGVRRKFHSDLQVLLGTLRQRTTLPLVVGFGVSNHAQFQQLSAFCDGVVVGSALVREIGRHEAALLSDAAAEREQAEQQIAAFVRQLIGGENVGDVLQSISESDIDKNINRSY